MFNPMKSYAIGLRLGTAHVNIQGGDTPFEILHILNSSDPEIIVDSSCGLSDKLLKEEIHSVVPDFDYMVNIGEMTYFKTTIDNKRYLLTFITQDLTTCETIEEVQSLINNNKYIMFTLTHPQGRTELKIFHQCRLKEIEIDICD